MGDRYATFTHTRPGRALVRRLGLPAPPKLRRYAAGEPLLPGPVLLGAAPDGQLAAAVATLLIAADVQVVGPVAESETAPDAAPGAAPATEPGAGQPADRQPDQRLDQRSDQQPDRRPDRRPRFAALVFDATGITDSADLRAAYDFLHPHLPGLDRNGRVLMLGRPVDPAAGTATAAAQQALTGLTRSLAKEIGYRGATAQLVRVAPGAERNLAATLRFLLSARSAYVSGQVIQVQSAPEAAPADWRQPLAGKVALVTGAARGIGAATARVLARDGAQVVCLDVAAAGEALAAVANEVRGTALQLDLTADDAPARLVAHLRTRHGRLDLLVHNAGITRDRTLAKLPAEDWDAVLGVNLRAVERTTEAVLDAGLIPDGGRLVAVSSMNGIAGNRGQTNYAAAKAGLVGLVAALAPRLAERGATANAVAPGFIETPMTDRMPKLARELGRRINSLSQAGQPVDVAETIAWLASPGSGGINGQVVRVCGQSLIGA